MGVAEDMKSIREMVGDSKEFQTFVYTPGIAADEKMAAVSQISKKMSPMSQNFLMLLVENKRLDLVSKMIDSFEELYREEKGIKVAKGVTAAEITSAQKQAISKAVSRWSPASRSRSSTKFSLRCWVASSRSSVRRFSITPCPARLTGCLPSCSPLWVKCAHFHLQLCELSRTMIFCSRNEVKYMHAKARGFVQLRRTKYFL